VTVYRKIAAGELRAVRLDDETSALRIPRRETERIYEVSAGGGSSVGSASEAAGELGRKENT
jgi:hypothetical protein